MNANKVCLEWFFSCLQHPEWELTLQVAEVVAEAGPFGGRIVEALMDSSLARVEEILKIRQEDASGPGSSGNETPVGQALENVGRIRLELRKNGAKPLSLPQGGKLSLNSFFLPQQLLVMAHAMGPDVQRRETLGRLVQVAASFHQAFGALAGAMEDSREILRMQAEYAQGAMKRATGFRDSGPACGNRLRSVFPKRDDSYAWVLKLGSL